MLFFLSYISININYHSSILISFFRTEKGYPLTIEAAKIEYEESPCDIDFIKNMLLKINYKTLLLARSQIIDHCATQLGSDFILPELPETIDGVADNSGDKESSSNLKLDEELLKSIHKILLDIHIVEGHLVCPDTGRRFKVFNGIPNMILHEDEI